MTDSVVTLAHKKEKYSPPPLLTKMDGFLVEGDLSNKFGNCLIYFLAFINMTAYHLGRYES